MSGSWEDPVVEEQFSYFCSGSFLPTQSFYFEFSLSRRTRGTARSPERWGWARDSLPADYCKVCSVDNDGGDVTCLTQITFSSRESCWLWTKVSAVSRAAATSGPSAVRPGGDWSSSGWRDFSAINESNDAGADCAGTDVHTMVRLPVFPLQLSEALRAYGRGERDLWISPDSH